ncbi:unnamed protein product [Lactuca virosa]|uniref:Uncharacterized protein n=1 Tax=Lactuca virosa TaxID=75947 RepID=A0AAU9M7A8_9ASTR|nr:unnamed protein product [Lactuca virosa]
MYSPKMINHVCVIFIRRWLSSAMNILLQEFEQLLGVTTPTEVNIENHGPIRNKGSGLRKILKGSNEVSKKKSSNEPRSCKYRSGPRRD